MQVIPVLDLLNGLIVHAKKGDRRNYLPVDSQLCPSSNPTELISCLLSLYDFKCIYIADLDALQYQGNNSGIVETICQNYPELEIWLDTGLDLISHYLKSISHNSLRIILSTESIGSISTFIKLIDRYANHPFLLSIDYKSGELLGPHKILEIREYWPADIIILNLDHVGSNEGIKLPAELNRQALFENHQTFYGGGVRNCKDLYKLKTLGIKGALLTTALHNKAITKSDLLSLNQ